MPALSFDSSHAALVEGITKRRGLLCLVGEAGTGKTLLLRRLLEAPPPGVRPVVLQDRRFELEALAELIARQLGAASGAGLAGLRTALAAEAHAGRSVVLLVDDAHALPPERLAALQQLIEPLPGSSGSGMQVLLAGRPALLTALRAAGLRDRVAILARLEPWVPTDVAVYIHGQLAHAGAPRRLFTPGAVARLARLTEGVPRGVNTIAGASLAAAARAGARTVGEEHVNAAWKSCARREAAPAADLDEPRFVRESAPPPVHERGLPPPVPATLPRRTRRRARRLPAVALAALLLWIFVARAPSWWHRRAGTAPEAPRVAAAPARPREPLPTPGEALDAVDAFRRAYEARDTAAIEELVDFEPTAGGVRFGAVAPDVRVLDRLEDVAYLQPAAQVEARGDAMEVRTSFEIRYRDRAGGTGDARGTAVWEVARRDGTPRIVGLTRALAPGSVLPGAPPVAKP